MHGNHGWRDAAIDAGIAAGSAFFGVLAGVSVVGIRADPGTMVLAGAVAAGIAFFGSLTAARQRPKPPSPS